MIRAGTMIESCCDLERRAERGVRGWRIGGVAVVKWPAHGFGLSGLLRVRGAFSGGETGATWPDGCAFLGWKCNLANLAARGPSAKLEKLRPNWMGRWTMADGRYDGIHKGH